MAEEVHWARVRAAMAAVALRKGGRRWRPSAERAVVRAERVAGGSGTCANESRTIHAKLGPKMVTNWPEGGCMALYDVWRVWLYGCIGCMRCIA